MRGGPEDEQDARETQGDCTPAPDAYLLLEQRTRQGGREQGRGESDGDRVGQGDQLQRIIECQHRDDVEAGAQQMAGEAPGPQCCQAAGSMGNARGDEEPDDVTQEADLQRRIVFGQPLHGGVENHHEERARQHVKDGPAGKVA